MSAYNAFSPRPADTTPIGCPGCGHGVNDHLANPTGCEGLDIGRAWCRCQWTPNDITHTLLFGGLSKLLHDGPTPPNPDVATVRTADGISHNLNHKDPS